MFHYPSPRRYGVLAIEHTPKMRIHSQNYADDDHIEVIGEKGILFINRYTTRIVDLPLLRIEFNNLKLEDSPAWMVRLEKKC
jgi:hypothetical protein